MVDDVQARAAALLSEHCRTSGMAVSMGWTCRCGHWCENINDATGHQAAMLAEAGLLAVGQVGEVPGSPGDLAGGLAGMLRAAGLLSPPSPRARTHRGGTRACRAVDDALAPRGTTRRGSARSAPSRCGRTPRAHQWARLGAGGAGKC
jgi:hypothetical protein